MAVEVVDTGGNWGLAIPSYLNALPTIRCVTLENHHPLKMTQKFNPIYLHGLLVVYK